jgi:hypothetical protein
VSISAELSAYLEVSYGYHPGESTIVNVMHVNDHRELRPALVHSQMFGQHDLQPNDDTHVIAKNATT